jgi:hypothetical protein
MNKSPEKLVVKCLATGLSACLGVSACSGAALSKTANSHESATTLTSNETAQSKFVELVSDLEQLKLAWGKGPGQPGHGEAAYSVLPDGNIVKVIIQAMNKTTAKKTYMPKPSVATHVNVLVYPKGTALSRTCIDAIPEYSNSITKNMDTNGNTEKNVVDDQILYSGVTHPDYTPGPNLKNSYFLDVDGSDIYVQVGNSLPKETVNQTKANAAFNKMGNQALAVAGAADHHHNVSFPEILIPGI